MNYENISFSVIFSVIISVCMVTGCRTTGITDPAITESAKQIGRIEAAVSQFDERINGIAAELSESNSRFENAINDSRGITESVDVIIREFGEYKSAVERLLSEIDDLRTEIKNSQPGDYDSGRNNSN